MCLWKLKHLILVYIEVKGISEQYGGFVKQEDKLQFLSFSHD